MQMKAILICVYENLSIQQGPMQKCTMTRIQKISLHLSLLQDYFLGFLNFFSFFLTVPNQTQVERTQLPFLGLKLQLSDARFLNN